MPWRAGARRTTGPRCIRDNGFVLDKALKLTQTEFPDEQQQVSPESGVRVRDMPEERLPMVGGEGGGGWFLRRVVRKP